MLDFMIVRLSATCAPVERIVVCAHEMPLGIAGYLREGHTIYDVFVLKNKTKRIFYYQAAAGWSHQKPAGGLLI